MSAVFRCTWPMSTPGSIGRAERSTGMDVVVSFIPAVYLIPQLFVEWLLASREHVDEGCDAPRARLRPLRVVRAIEDRVAVMPVELGERRSRLRVRVERALQVVRHGDAAGRVVRRVPA